MRRSLTLLVALAATILFTSTPATAGDPAKATVTATLVDKWSKSIPRLVSGWSGDACDEVTDWRDLSSLTGHLASDMRNASSFGSGPTWCKIGIHVMARGDTVEVAPNKSGDFGRKFIREHRTVRHADIADLKAEIDGIVTFRVYPGVGTVVLTTDPIKGNIYYGEIDSSKLRPGVENKIEEPVVMRPLPVVEVVTPVQTIHRSQLVNFGDGIVWPKPVDSRTSEVRRPIRRATSTGVVLEGGYSLAGRWVVMPGEYAVNGGLIPEGRIAMVRKNDTVVPFDANKPVVATLGDRIVISIGSAVE